MGLATIGRVASNYNNANDAVNAGNAFTGSQDNANNFLHTWINEKLPEMITGVAVRVVDDGSGTIAKEVLDAGTDKSFLGSLFN